MHSLLEKLKKDHGNLEKILALLTVQLDRFFAGRESNFDLKIELLEYLETYADQVHHPLENLIFDKAINEVGEKRELLERMQSQHKSLILLTRKFRHSLENILQGGVMPRNELEVQGREYVALQRQHISLEEQEVFPIIDAALNEYEWNQVIASMLSHDDPVFDAPDTIRFQILVEYLSQSEDLAVD